MKSFACRFGIFSLTLLAVSATNSTASCYAQNRTSIKRSPSIAIRAVVDTQITAWNAGKLEEFMGTYWHSPKLVFVSVGRGRSEGWDAVFNQYRKTYQSPGREMGKFTVTNLDINVLSSSTAIVRGQWKLRMSNGSEPSGSFKQVFNRFKNGWKVISEETTLEPVVAKEQEDPCSKYYPGYVGRIEASGWLSTKDGFIVRYVNKNVGTVTIEGTTGGNSLERGRYVELSCSALKERER